MDMKTTKAWEKNVGQPNILLRIHTSIISYNPNTNIGLSGMFTGMFGIGEGESGEETALETSDGTWRILKGDFRSQYEACETDQDCLDVYNKYKAEHRGDWSTDDYIL